ncbi:MAG: hypothetical protein H7X99_01895 [Saprospiraceae bacterium]|nr:hypothetical protein [Saprospiraceae bacterium]
MGNSAKVILIITGILLVALFVISLTATKPIDWKPSYNTKDKVPLGLFVLEQEIDSFFISYVERSVISLEDYFYDGVFEDSILFNYNLIFINQEVFWNEKNVHDVLRFVDAGNSAFISALNLPEILLDSLGLKLESFEFIPQTDLFLKDSLTISFVDTCELNAKISYHKGISGSFFTKYDTIRSYPLGYVVKEQMLHSNFIKVLHGHGEFYIHLEPAAFTNYFLLTDDYYRYAESAFSYIPAHYDIVWSLHNQTSKVISDSPLRFIKSQPALYWAWTLLIIGVLLFVLFNIRRSQRIINIIPKPKNTSVDFVKTVGNLYYLEGDIRDMMQKMIIYLLEKLRTDYQLNTEVLDEKFIHLLQSRSGKDIEKIKKMVFLINKHQNTDYTCKEDDLKRLNTSIDNLFNK